MEAFRVTFRLVEPVLVNRSVAFDGLLAHLTYLRSGIVETAHTSLPLASSDGIYRASELLFLGPVMRRPVQFVMNPRWERLEYGMLGGARGRPRRKMTARDQFKPQIDAYTAVSAREAVVVGFGNIAEISTLIRDLDAIGKKSRARAFGRLDDVTIDAIHDAPKELGFADFAARPVRAVPIETWRALGLSGEDVSVGPARPRLPRWTTDDELCALPSSHVIEPHEQNRIGL